MTTRTTTVDQSDEEQRVFFGELPNRTNTIERVVVASSKKVESLIAGQGSRSIIDVSCQRLTDADMANVIKYAVHEKKCKILNLWGNQFTADSMPMLVNALYDNRTLKELDLANNRLGDAGVKVLAKFLASNRCAIREIDLSSNEITDEAADHLADMLSRNDTLKILSLNKNYIEDDGLARIARGIRNGNRRLQQLRLESNPLITSEGVLDTLETLKDNRTLLGVYFKGFTPTNQIPKESVETKSYCTGFDVFV